MENLKVFENDINRATYFESDDYVNPHVSCLEDGSKVVFCNGVTITAKASAATTLPIIYKASSTFDKPDKTVQLKANEVTTVTIERPYIYSPGLYTEGLTLWGGGESNTAVTEIAIDGTLMSPENAFRGCSGLTSIDLTKTNTDVSGISVIMTLGNSMDNMFSGCTNITSLDVSNLDTRYMTGMSHMFYYCKSLTSLDVSRFDTSKVTDMNSMFYCCSGLTSLDVSNFNTSNVTDMYAMFQGCCDITSLDLSSFNTSKVTNMSSMFNNCKSLTSLDVSNFNTSNVTNMSWMFDSCQVLASLDVSNFNTSKVTNMSGMFSSCGGLTTLDVSNFDTSNVTNMSYVFYYCKSLTSLNLGTFDMGKVTTSTDTFRGINPKVEITLAADSPSLTKIQTQLITDGVTGAKIHFNGKTYAYDTATKAWKGA